MSTTNIVSAFMHRMDIAMSTENVRAEYGPIPIPPRNFFYGDLLVACYDGRHDGGTAQCVRDAKRKGRTVIVLKCSEASE